MRRPKILWLWKPGNVATILPDFFPSSEVEIVLPEDRASPVGEEELKALIADADFVVMRRQYRITRDVINTAKRVKLIQCLRALVDNVDLDAAKEAGIPVANMYMALDAGAAEQTIMLVLVLSRKLLDQHQSVVNGEYRKMSLKPAKPREDDPLVNWSPVLPEPVIGKTIGLIGLGNVGREVAARARSFGMRILYFKRHKLLEDEERKLGVEYRPFDKLLMESDFVSLHVPYTDATSKMIGEHEFSLMKPTAYFINVARGGLVDQEAMHRALKNRVIAGAGLDRFEEEPLPWDNPFIKLDNVVLTPHAGNPSCLISIEEIQRIKENIYRVMKGERPSNIINGL